MILNTRVFQIVFLLLASTGMAVSQPQASAAKPRIIVTTDPELDDSNSIIRLLLYSTDYHIEGLIYASSEWHWRGDGTGKKWYVANREYSRPGMGTKYCPCTSHRWEDADQHFIDDRVDAYAKVYPNLKVHDHGYPDPAYLKSIVRYGNVDFEGEMSKDTPGSELIKQRILADEPGPLYITAWGGPSTIARALKSIQDQYEGTAEWDTLQQKISEKVVLLLSGDQDRTDTRYIRPNWPNIRHGISGGWRGVPLGYNGQARLLPADQAWYSPEWEQANISSKGTFGSLWRVWGDGKWMSTAYRKDTGLNDPWDFFGESGKTLDELKAMGYLNFEAGRRVEAKGAFLAEGDTGTFLALLNTGLRYTINSPAPPPPGGAAVFDRYGPAATAARAGGPVASGNRGPQRLDPDFVPALWNDFATRMTWSVTPTYKNANHNPTVTVNGPLNISAAPGATVQLSAITSDPDGDQVTLKWWQYKGQSTYPSQVTIADPAALATSFQVPADAKPGQTISIVAEATDNGTPALTHYQQLVITVQGN